MSDISPGSPARLEGVEAGHVTLEMRYADGNTESLNAEVTKDAVIAVSFQHVELAKASGKSNNLQPIYLDWGLALSSLRMRYS